MTDDTNPQRILHRSQNTSPNPKRQQTHCLPLTIRLQVKNRSTIHPIPYFLFSKHSQFLKALILHRIGHLATLTHPEKYSHPHINPLNKIPKALTLHPQGVPSHQFLNAFSPLLLLTLQVLIILLSLVLRKAICHTCKRVHKTEVFHALLTLGTQNSQAECHSYPYTQALQILYRTNHRGISQTAV